MTTTEKKRPEAPMIAGEREQLNGFLDFLRSAVVLKATGLTDEQARRQLMPSELTTVAGLVSHLTLVEQYWFGQVLDNQPDLWRERLEEDPDAEFRVALGIPLDRLIADYEAECQRSSDVVAKLELDATGTTAKGQPVNVRWVLIHMIEETGRHAGHLDLLRELLDGSVGE